MSRKPDYLTNEQFVVVWMKHAVRGGSLADVVEEVARVCRESGRPAMPAASVAAKAAYLRTQGVRLPKLKVGAKPANETERLNALVAAVAGGEDVDPDALAKLEAVPDSNFAPDKDPRPVIKEVIAGLKARQ